MKKDGLNDRCVDGAWTVFGHLNGRAVVKLFHANNEYKISKHCQITVDSLVCQCN